MSNCFFVVLKFKKLFVMRENLRFEPLFLSKKMKQMWKNAVKNKSITHERVGKRTDKIKTR